MSLARSVSEVVAEHVRDLVHDRMLWYAIPDEQSTAQVEGRVDHIRRWRSFGVFEWSGDYVEDVSYPRSLVRQPSAIGHGHWPTASAPLVNIVAVEDSIRVGRGQRYRTA